MKHLQVICQQCRDGITGCICNYVFFKRLLLIFLSLSFYIVYSQKLPGAGLAGTGRLSVHTISISTLKGDVVDIKVPNNIQPGDRISGSIVSAKSSSILKGAVVEVQGKQTNFADKLFEIIVPMGLTTIPFLLKNSKGKTIASTTIPVNGRTLPAGPNGTVILIDQLPKPVQTAPGNFAPMNYAQPGQPLAIPGNFDGNAENTKVSINNVPCEILTEGPRGANVLVPEGLNAGKGSVNINEAGVSQTTPIQVVTINLATNTPSILKNTTSKIDCTVNGLENLDLDKNHFKLVLINQSPSTISFAGNNPTEISYDLNKGNVSNGTASFSIQANGIRSGTYTVAANVNSTTCTECWE